MRCREGSAIYTGEVRGLAISLLHDEVCGQDCSRMEKNGERGLKLVVAKSSDGTIWNIPERLVSRAGLEARYSGVSLGPAKRSFSERLGEARSRRMTRIWSLLQRPLNTLYTNERK